MHDLTDRHSEAGHPVHGRDAQVALVDLSLPRTRLQALPEHALDAAHRRLGERAAVIADLLLPGLESVALDHFQCRTARMHTAVGQRLPDGGVGARRDGGAGLALQQQVMTGTAVIGAIGRDLGDVALDLRQQLRQHFGIADRRFRHQCGHHLVRGRIHRQMQLSPDATVTCTVLAHLPLALAEHLQPGRIDQQMARRIARPALDRHAQQAPAASARVVVKF